MSQLTDQRGPCAVPECRRKQRTHIDALSSALAAYGKRARHAIDQTDEPGDQGTADIFTEISRGVEEHLWFVEAHVGQKVVESGHPVTTPDDRQLEDSVGSILASYGRQGELAHLEGGSLPSREVIWGVVEDLLRVLFPGYLETSDLVASDLAARTMTRVRSIAGRLRTEIERGLRFQSGRAVSAADCEDCGPKAEAATLKLLAEIPDIRAVLGTDIEASYERDPAAQSFQEIILAYPGLQATAVYRLAHVLHAQGVPIVPRVMSEYAHSRTGIDIHPGARIGRRFFIDHGTGVVIGETCEIGDEVTIYQGVTLGALNFPRDTEGRVIKGTKRHPDIENGVIIYSGATILGPVRIGAGSVVGGNVWLTQSVPPKTRIVASTPQLMHVDQPVPDYQI